MKKTLTVTLFFVMISFCYSQHFEGIVEYEMHYIPTSDRYTTELMEEAFGKRTKTFFKDGFYKELTDSKFMSYQLFRYDKNKIYYKHTTNDDTLRYISTISTNKSNFKYDLYTKSDTVLTIVCDKLVVRDDYGTKTYYYSSDYSLNPEFYINFTISNKYEIVKLMKSIYLKLEMEYQDFVVEITAKEITRKKLKKKVFKLTKHTTLLEE